MADETVTTVAKRGGIKREDPPPRPVEQTANRGYLEGADPTKHYVWVSEVNDPTINVGYYKHLGYQISQYDPTEARPTLGYQEYKQGWEVADRIEDTIRNRDIEPLTAGERIEFRGITSTRPDQDDRRKWQF